MKLSGSEFRGISDFDLAPYSSVYARTTSFYRVLADIYVNRMIAVKPARMA
jgi:hypothetical protein